MENIIIDGKSYDAETFSPEARAQLVSLQVTDQKIAEQQAVMAIYQTARAAYARELLALLPKTQESQKTNPGSSDSKRKK